jgi:hypothetical protein
MVHRSIYFMKSIPFHQFMGKLHQFIYGQARRLPHKKIPVVGWAGEPVLAIESKKSNPMNNEL